MNSPSNRDDELRRREEELRQRELELRIRELESEIKSRGPANSANSGQPNATSPDMGTSSDQPPVNPTRKYNGKKTRWNQWNGKLWLGLQFALIVIAVIAAIRIANWLGMALIIGMIAWVAYKVFFETD